MFRSILQKLKCAALHTRDVDDVSTSGHRIIRCEQGCPTQVLRKPLGHIQRQRKERRAHDVASVVRR